MPHMRVVASPVNKQEPTCGDRFRVDVRGSSLTVTRIDAATGWTQPLRLQAFPPQHEAAVAAKAEAGLGADAGDDDADSGSGRGLLASLVAARTDAFALVVRWRDHDLAAAQEEALRVQRYYVKLQPFPLSTILEQHELVATVNVAWEAGLAERECRITGLLPDTAYSIKVVAQNTVGIGPASIESTTGRTPPLAAALQPALCGWLSVARPNPPAGQQLGNMLEGAGRWLGATATAYFGPAAVGDTEGVAEGTRHARFNTVWCVATPPPLDGHSMAHLHPSNRTCTHARRRGQFALPACARPYAGAC